MRDAGPTAEDESNFGTSARLTSWVILPRNELSSLLQSLCGSASELTNVALSSHWGDPPPSSHPLSLSLPDFEGFLARRKKSLASRRALFSDSDSGASVEENLACRRQRYGLSPRFRVSSLATELRRLIQGSVCRSRFVSLFYAPRVRCRILFLGRLPCVLFALQFFYSV